MSAARKYQMTRIKAGDYLVPSNDAQHIFRVNTYEDSAPYIDWKSKDAGVMHIGETRTRWQVHRCKLTVAQLDALGDLPVDFLDWDRWQYVAGDYPSRAAALKEAL